MGQERLTLRGGMRRAGLHPVEVWLRYINLGGNGSASDVERCLARDWCPDDREHNLLAHAINEALLDDGGDFPVSYRYPFGPTAGSVDDDPPSTPPPPGPRESPPPPGQGPSQHPTDQSRGG